jgi:anti-sigma factor RsiW
MKPCVRNRKLIACLAAGALEEASARELRAHLETCPGCRRYFEEMSAVTAKLAFPKDASEVHTTTAFHQAWLRRLPTQSQTSFWHQLAEQLQALRSSWRVALPAFSAVALVVLIGLLSFVHRPPLSPTTGPTHITEAQTKEPLAPTLANYERVATRSLDEFDALLTVQAQRPPPAAPLYTASLLMSSGTYRED